MTDAVRAHYAFASDNTAGTCPEALAALAEANTGRAPSYGDDAHTRRAKKLFNNLFETKCDVFFVFNGTAANALVLAAMCQRHHAIVTHAMSHVDNDECGAPEFFTGGSKVLTLDAPLGKLRPRDIEPVLTRGHGVHFPKIRAISLTQATELGTVYTPDELRAVAKFAHGRGLFVHVDGARFANAAAALASKKVSPADLTWRAGVDALCFGGTKNGLLTTEAVVIFNKEVAREFDYRVKQSGQLASKMRFASAQWVAVLRDGAWLRHAAHANAQAKRLADGLVALGFKLVAPVEANGVFVEFAPAVVAALETRGWHFYKFIGEHGYRLMCSWETRDEEVAAFLADAKAAKNEKPPAGAEG
jgi:threonine aldolase